MCLGPTQENENRRVFARAAMAPRFHRILGLSLAFRAQSLALAHPCYARFGAANASERPWRAAKPAPHPKRMKTGGSSPEQSKDRRPMNDRELMPPSTSPRFSRQTVGAGPRTWPMAALALSPSRLRPEPSFSTLNHLGNRGRPPRDEKASVPRRRRLHPPGC